MAQEKTQSEPGQMAPTVRAVANVGSYNKKKRTVEVTAATDYPVTRWMYDQAKRDYVDFNEILSFAPEHMNAERLEQGVVPLLDNHNRFGGAEGVRGVVSDYNTENGQLNATVRFSKREESQAIADDVEDGILKGFSLGYRVHEYTPDGTTGENGLPNYVATRWEPLELSAAPIPADPRSTARSIDDVKNKHTAHVIRKIEETPTPAPKPKKETPQQREVATNKHTMKNSTELKKLREDKTRLLQSLNDQAERSEADETRMDELAAEIATLGTQIEAREQREAVLAATAAPAPTGDGERKEINAAVRAADFGRAFASLHDGKELKGAIGEINAEGQRHSKEGGGSNVLSYPTAWLGRAGGADDFQAGSGDGSGFVPTEVPAFIQALMAPTVMETAGVTVLNGLVGTVQFPRESVAASATAEGEVDADAGSGLEIDQWQMSPKRYSSNTKYSKQLLLQSPLAAEQIIGDALRRGMNRKLNTDMFTGAAGGASITGLFNYTGINEPITTDSTDYEAIAAALRKSILANHGDVTTAKMILSPTSDELFGSAANVTGVDALIRDGRIKGMEFMATPYVADATADIRGRVVAGNFDNILMGNYGSLDFVIDPFTSAGTAQIIIHLNRWVDMLVQNPDGFAFNEHVSNS